MESPLIYALNCIVADTPWYVMACVPFWETRRVKKITLCLVLSVLLALRITGAYLITAYTRDWHLWETCFILVLYLVMLAIYIAISGASPVKVVYIFLMLFLMATFSKFLANFLVTFLIPAGRSPYDTIRYAAVLTVLLGLILPFVYKTFHGLMRRAFSELPDRTILMLCFTSAVFFVLLPFISLSVGSSGFVKVVISLVGFAACYCNVYMTLDAVKSIQAEKALSLEKRLAQESYGRVQAHLHEMAGVKHDMNKHLAAMRVYLDSGRIAEARDYLTQYAEQLAVVTETGYSEHFLINAIAGNICQKAGEYGIKTEADISAAPEHIAAPDLYGLLSNLMDNALEACMAVPEEKWRFIRLTVTKREPYLNIRLMNSKSGETVSVDGKIQTTKAGEGHGYGLRTIERIVNAYDGMMNIEYDDKTFKVTLALKDRPTVKTAG